MNTVLWVEQLECLKIYIKVNNRLPSKHNSNTTIHKLALWVNKQNNHYNNNIMSDSNIRLLWKNFMDEHIQYFCFKNNKVHLWKRNLLNAKQYMDKYNIIPSKYSNDKETKQIGSWIVRQRHNYKYNKCIMKYKYIQDLWNDFMDKYITVYKLNYEMNI